ncbi:TPA: hypothetical protein DCZ81_02775 [Candidatus Collierbacteria bacterium]|nr:hypothetical protein [Candidatus Collierbacteria bacterium]HCX25436.1 hypothetical protein [Candidatus Collierbacteria bacterium]
MAKNRSGDVRSVRPWFVGRFGVDWFEEKETERVSTFWPLFNFGNGHLPTLGRGYLELVYNEVVNKMSGFTLMEIMIVIGLIMILSTVGINSFILSTVKSRDSQRKNDLNQLGKAVESFYVDVGRYPLSTDGVDVPLCYARASGVVTNSLCTSNKLASVIDGVTTIYITIPSDPVVSLKYPYVSDGLGYSLYTALENTLDRDLVKDAQGDMVTYPDVSCGSGSCNYKIIETGLVKGL